MKAYVVIGTEYHFEVGISDYFDREYYLKYEDAKQAFERMIGDFKSGEDYDSSFKESRGKNWDNPESRGDDYYRIVENDYNEYEFSISVIEISE